MQRTLRLLTEFVDGRLNPHYGVPAPFHFLPHSLVLRLKLRFSQIQPLEQEFMLFGELRELFNESLPIASLNLQY